MKNLKNFDFKNKRALVRCDFDVPLSDSKTEILNDFRIKQALPTIKYLIKEKAKIILISHLGRPKGKVVEKLRLSLIQDRLMGYLSLPVTKKPNCINSNIEEWTRKMNPGEILLLENLRFHKEEEEGDLKFAQKLAKFGDVYVNNAFATSHRSHASITGIPKFLPSVAGLLLEKEIKILSRVLENPWQPLVAIVGGIKIDTKIKLIEQLLKKADHLLLGSKPAEIILIIKEILVGRPFSGEKEVFDRIKKIDLTSPKLHLPTDGQMALSNLEEGYSRIGAIGTLKKEENVFDIGPETIKIYKEIIRSAKMIVWNGSLGMFEKKPFDKGTKEIAEAIARNYSAFKIVGGGDTVGAISELGFSERFDHISTGGGAMLEFLSGDKLPGIEALK